MSITGQPSREEIVRHATHSIALEGGVIDEEQLNDLYAWARGELDDKELTTRGRDIAARMIVRYPTAPNEVLQDRMGSVLTVNALVRLTMNPVPQTFDWKHLSRIHRYLFRDVSPWAGEPRSIRVGRRGKFAGYRNDDVAACVDALTEPLRRHSHTMRREHFISMASTTYMRLTSIQPFDEGNGLTQRTFMDDLARRGGWRFDWNLLDIRAHEAVRDAAREGKPELLEATINNIVLLHRATP